MSSGQIPFWHKASPEQREETSNAFPRLDSTRMYQASLDTNLTEVQGIESHTLRSRLREGQTIKERKEHNYFRKRGEKTGYNFKTNEKLGLHRAIVLRGTSTHRD
mmetsp:Transcript_24051/g.51291  ORF Transcript_24051/g.51291 Transcript_24051/m.51291 type:complete len:105 (+) Transcript_24051:16-330(+)